MNDNHADALLEEKLRAALGSAKPPDFDGWLSQHKAAIACLNPVTTARLHRKRKLLSWAGRVMVALAACALVAIFWKNGGEQASFAQAVKAAQDAHTVTLNQTIYNRDSSKDGQNTWIRRDHSSFAYRHPGQWRFTDLDQQGNPQWVEIVDLQANKTLQLNLKTKKATWANHSRNQYGPDGPISSAKILDHHQDAQLVGHRKVGNATANVFRYYLKGDHSSFDVWVDANTKQLLGYSSPGADVFDLDTMADRNNPPGKFYEGALLGTIVTDIVVDAKLDDDLFDMKVPDGFEVVVQPPEPPVTEQQLIEYLRTTAQFNGGMFVETAQGPGIDLLQQAAKKAKSDRTEAEQKMVDLNFKYMMTHHSYPIWDFAEANAVPKSLRYIGGGVKLGDAERIVCWYKLKDTGKWRAVYGDLSVKDVDPKDLPLPVE